MDRSNGGWLDQDGVYIGDAELEAAIRCGDVTLDVNEPEPSHDYARGRADALRDAVAAVRAVTHEGSGVAKSFNGGVIAARAVLEKMR